MLGLEKVSPGVDFFDRRRCSLIASAKQLNRVKEYTHTFMYVCIMCVRMCICVCMYVCVYVSVYIDLTLQIESYTKADDLLH